jgi:hypothetical protein
MEAAHRGYTFSDRNKNGCSNRLSDVDTLEGPRERSPGASPKAFS